MEKVNRILVTKKEGKKVEELLHLLELAGVDFSSLENRVKSLEEENKALRADNEDLENSLKELKKELADARDENIKLIQKELGQIAVNVRNEASKNAQLMGDKLFKGSQINEKY